MIPHEIIKFWRNSICQHFVAFIRLLDIIFLNNEENIVHVILFYCKFVIK